MNGGSKVAVITGASQSIGSQLVRGFLDSGYRVVATGQLIPHSDDPDLLTIAGDIRDRKIASGVVTAALEEFGRIDTLVNNASVFVAKPFVDYSEGDLASIVADNFGGFFHVTQIAAAHMLTQRSGHIVNVIASLVDRPDEFIPAGLASLTRGGLGAVTEALALEFADRGVRVNAVATGVIKTHLRGVTDEGSQAGPRRPVRLGEIQDVVDAILYLEMASFVSGEIHHVDGGSHAGRW